MLTRSDVHLSAKRVTTCGLILGICLALFFLVPSLKASGIAFVQVNYATPHTAQTSVGVTFSLAQTTGDLNVVMVGWADSTSSVSSVVDTMGNTYTPVVGPTVQTGFLTQSIYYAKNITGAAANGNTVTVTFNAAAAFPDIRILEYSGADTTSPLDVVKAGTGTSSPTNSGSVTTTNANDLILGASMVWTSNTAAGTGYTLRILTQPDHDIVEDKMVTAKASYSATAPLNNAGPWIMQLVAFKAAASTDTQPPTAPTNLTATAASASQINLTWTASTDNVGVTGYKVEQCQGAGCTNFVQIATPTGTTFNATGLAASTSYSYRVRATDAAGNLSTYSNTASATTASGTTATIRFVQSDYAVPPTANPSVNIPYTLAQTVGDLNVVVVGWADSTAQVSSVADTMGNAYFLVVGPTVQPGFLTQSIYYAKNIAGAAANGNTVTVTFNAAAAFPDIRILEYSGADTTSPADVVMAGTGTSSPTNSGSVTTTNANDLILGASMVETSNTAAGAGYTLRILTQPDHDIVEDKMVTAAGSYSATAPLNNAGPWIMQLVSLKAGPGGSTPPVAISVAPQLANVGTGLSQQFTATVQNSSNVGVNWTLSGTGCAGIACGTLSNATDNPLTYTAPGSVPNPATVTLTATAAADQTKSAASTITVVIPAANVTLTPRATGLTFSQTQQFVAAVTGTLNTAVTWTVDDFANGNSTTGTLAVNGLTAIYTPPSSPGTHIIKAISVADSTKSASSSVAITDFAGIFTNHNDSARTGQNMHEFGLTPTNVNVSQFGKLFSCPIDGFAYAQPLYVPNLNIPNKGVHNVLYVATENDSVYAFDADDPTCNLLWFTSFLGPNISPVPAADTGDVDPDDLQPQIGITGAPVIDLSTNTLYVVPNTKEPGPTYFYRLHALDITTGVEKFGGPVEIKGSVPGTGDASSGGQVPFTPLFHLQRPGLLLLNGIVYIVFGSHGDVGLYHGWIFGYNAQTLNQTAIFNAGPNGTKGSIWQTGGGPSADASGNIYAVTANGTFDANIGGVDYGDSFLKLMPNGSLSVADYFTPSNQNSLDTHDFDVGTTSPIVLPDSVGSTAHPHLLVGGAKDGLLYLLDRDNMGHFHTVDQVVQEVTATKLVGKITQGVFGSLAYWSNNLYVCAVGDTLKVFSLANGLLSTSAKSQSSHTFGLRGAVPSVSANGSTNGIVWVIDVSANQTAGPSILYAYDATNLARELYDSTQAAGGRDRAAAPVKFSTPTVANSKVYVPTRSELDVYGLLP